MGRPSRSRRGRQRRKHQSDATGRYGDRGGDYGFPNRRASGRILMAKKIRVGCGYDVHPLGAGRKLILGGIEVPHSKGLMGHSDSDVLVHAVCDALLGAMGEGDLGRHYPSSDQKYKGISSLKLLEDVIGKLTKKGYRVVNVDTIIVAQAPRLSAFLAAMQKQMAQVMGIDADQVNVKVKSGEGLDAVGREEGMHAHAVCLIEAL